MFKPQKIEKKKLTAYIIIITIMFAGVGFFVYKNYSLTDQNNPVETNNVFSINKEESSETQNDKNGRLLSNIFNDPKFRALQDNSITQTLKINIGRENPFEPY